MQCMPFEWFWREPTIKADWGKYEYRLNVGGLLVTFLGVIIILCLAIQENILILKIHILKYSEVKGHDICNCITLK